MAKTLAPLQREQHALNEEYLQLLGKNKGLAGATLVGSFDVSLLSVPALFDVGLKLGGRVSGEGTGRPLLQPTPEAIVDTAAGLYGNATWDPDQKKIVPSVSVGGGPVAVTSYNPLYGKRVQLILAGICKVGMSRSCVGGTVKVGLPVGPRVGGTFFIEHPRLMPITNWIFDKGEGAAKKIGRVPGAKQGAYEVERQVVRTRAKAQSALCGLTRRARCALRARRQRRASRE